MAITKQSVGIDISQATFTVCLGQRSEDGKLALTEITAFGNDTNGFNQMLRWARA
jgi:hypothetical protein